jgi:capsule polysaccharide export protein KpsE/RkpR
MGVLMWDIFISVGERKRSALLIFVCSVIVGIVLLRIFPPEYTAKTVILPPSRQRVDGQGMGRALALLALGHGVSAENQREKYVALLKSTSVADMLDKRFNLRSKCKVAAVADIKRILAGKTSVIDDKESGFVVVEVTDRSRKLATDLANGYVEALRMMIERTKLAETQQRKIFYDSQVGVLNKKIAKLQNFLSDLGDSEGLVSIDGKMAEIIASEARARADLLDEEITIKVLEAYAADEDPEIIQMRARSSALREEIKRLQESGTGSVDMYATSKGDRGDATMSTYRELKADEAVLAELRKRLALAEIDEARESPPIQQLDIATSPEKETWPNSGVILKMFSLLGVFCAVGYAVFVKELARNAALRVKILELKKVW